jgi:uncharacterized protein YjbI with pentapeptide repeats
MRQTLSNLLRQVIRWWTIRKILIATILILLGAWWFAELFTWTELSTNLFSEAFGILVTVLVIDTINEHRAGLQLKAQLIRELGSSDNGIAVRAAKELQAHGWGFRNDKSLVGAYLVGANLKGAKFLRYINLEGADLHEATFEGADLWCANLCNANLWRANLANTELTGVNFDDTDLISAQIQNAYLQGASFRRANMLRADLSLSKFDNELSSAPASFEDTKLDHVNLFKAKYINDFQLAIAHSLHGSIMPDGNNYNGKFNLEGDLEQAQGPVQIVQAVLSNPGSAKMIFKDTGSEWDIGPSLLEMHGNSPEEAMAIFYDRGYVGDSLLPDRLNKVKVSDYLSGQEWARSNLEQARTLGYEWARHNMEIIKKSRQKRSHDDLK